MKKYLLIMFYSMTYNGKNKKEVIIRSLFYLTILFIFSKLWKVTQFSNSAYHELMIWYLSLTELIVLSIPIVQVDIENDIRSGDVVYQILKPIDYLWLKIAESTGAFIFRFIALMTISIPFTTYLSGMIPDAHILIASYFTAIIAGLVFILFHTMIGLLAFKLQDSSPIFWVWQRCSFLFGGMLIPLNFYPTYLRFIAYFLPFASLLFGPASLILEFNFENFMLVLAGLIFWGAVALFLTTYLYKKMLKILKVNGG